MSTSLISRQSEDTTLLLNCVKGWVLTRDWTKTAWNSLCWVVWVVQLWVINLLKDKGMTKFSVIVLGTVINLLYCLLTSTINLLMWKVWCASSVNRIALGIVLKWSPRKPVAASNRSPDWVVFYSCLTASDHCLHDIFVEILYLPFVHNDRMLLIYPYFGQLSGLWIVITWQSWSVKPFPRHQVLPETFWFRHEPIHSRETIRGSIFGGEDGWRSWSKRISAAWMMCISNN